MEQHKINLLELLYEEKPTTTEIVEYGTKLSELMAGKPPGPEGAHFDLHFVVNDLKGKLIGKGKGFISMTVRPDGISVVEIHETLTTEDGENILIKGSGYSLPGDEPGKVRFKGTYKFHTSSKKYAWLNSTIGVGEGGGNPLKGDVVVSVYSFGGNPESKKK